MSAPSPPPHLHFFQCLFLMMIPSNTLLTQIKAIGLIIPIFSGIPRDMKNGTLADELLMHEHFQSLLWFTNYENTVTQALETENQWMHHQLEVLVGRMSDECQAASLEEWKTFSTMALLKIGPLPIFERMDHGLDSS
ncbi:hypothetical protein B0H17DRAFT_1142639 [Mycena rosella]|uniref:Uncharacterized protein n=1 Tax=Mycena rosella TaxID=1033263 RepID=A0AAD7CXC7_MYCRO|nr:hypothetical protein B0H17DRAFT_1142639 [Mycena rosella]